MTVPSHEDRLSPSSSIPISHPTTTKEPAEPSSEASTIVSETPKPVERSPVVQPSRLPRRNATRDSKVAALVKQFQPPPKAMSGPSNYPRSPPIFLVSESEAEPERAPLRRSRSKGRPATIYPALGDGLTSDFERSYAANVAPRHFARTRHGHASRIPAPILSGSEAQSRTNSPVRSLQPGGRAVRFGASGFRSFSPPRADKSASPNPRKDKGKARERPSSIRLPPSKALGKRAVNTNRVGNIARHFERMAMKESEKSRKAAMRGRRARPVATARVTVEVLNTVGDGFRDHTSENSSSTSEADDEAEGEGEDGGGASAEPTPLTEAPPIDVREHQESPEPAPSNETSPGAEPDMATLLQQQNQSNSSLTHSQEMERVDSSALPSPFPGTFGTMADRDINGSEKLTLLKAFNPFKDWSQPQTDRGPEVVYPGYV